MKYLARSLLIIPTCLVAASSWSQPFQHHVTHSVHTAVVAPAGDASTQADGWLAGLLGVGLIALQLRRKQKMLLAPRLTS